MYLHAIVTPLESGIPAWLVYAQRLLTQDCNELDPGCLVLPTFHLVALPHLYKLSAMYIGVALLWHVARIDSNVPWVVYSSRFGQHAPFEVEVGNPPHLARNSFTEGAPDSARVSESGTAKAAEGAEKGKRKGRFQIVEEDASDPGKRGVGRSTSVASMDSHRSTQVSPLHQGLHFTRTCSDWLRLGTIWFWAQRLCTFNVSNQIS